MVGDATEVSEVGPRQNWQQLTRTRDEAADQDDAAGRGAWYPDPYGMAGERWWDGRKWTREVRGVPTVDATAAAANHVRRTQADRARSRVSAPPPDGSRICPDCRGSGYSLARGYRCATCGGRGRATRGELRARLFLMGFCLAFLIVSSLLGWHW
jgi:hypothetical protein